MVFLNKNYDSEQNPYLTLFSGSLLYPIGVHGRYIMTREIFGDEILCIY